MPFYRESYMVTEREEQKYANYQSAENSNMANQVLREISKKPMMLIEGASSAGTPDLAVISTI